MRNASGHESQNVRQPKKVIGNTQHFLHKTCSRRKQRQRDVQKGAGRAKLLFFFYRYRCLYRFLHDFIFCLSKL